MRPSQYIAYFFLSGVSAALIIVGLSTLYWRKGEQTISGFTVKYNYGLKKAHMSSAFGDQTRDIEGDDDATKQYLQGADTAISMGAIALGCIAGNVLLVALLKLCQGWTGGRARIIAIIFSIAAAILIIVGTVTYDGKLPSEVKDNTDYGWSFALYILGGLLPLSIAVALIIQRETSF